MFTVTDEQFNTQYNLIKHRVTFGCHSNTNPKAVILGGQPGAGKSLLQKHLLQENSNFVIISADDFRSRHPYFKQIQNEYEANSADYTQPFINKITEKLINELSDEKYNLIIEGTLRTATVPIKSCKQLKSKDYNVELQVIAVKPIISYYSTILRYENAIASGKEPRATTKYNHDRVVNSIADNLNIIYNENCFDDIKIYTRNNDCIYSLSDGVSPAQIEKSFLSSPLSEQERNQLDSIINEIAILKNNRNADDFQTFLETIKEIDITNDKWFMKVNPKQAEQLRTAGISFEGKISNENDSVIKINIDDKDKALSAINSKSLIK